MVEILHSMRRKIERLVMWLTALGAIIVLVQMVWISYGVIVRYVFDAPDRMVTEATAMLLFPVAFAGLAYALKEDAYPKVTMLLDILPSKVQQRINFFNHIVMTLIGGFFATAAVSATIRSYNSGSASEILLWPRSIFWLPVAFMLIVFTAYALLKTVLVLADNSKHSSEAE